MEFKHSIVPKNIQKTVKSDQKVVVRFPPEPSGYLHIGHIKALYINASFAKQHNGDIIIRFDDTNPALESTEYETAIMEDLKTLKVDTSKVSYTSDYFSKLISFADVLIDKGCAYVDLTDVELMRKMRETSTHSDYRDEKIDTIKERWHLMKSGQTKSGVLRLKTDLSHKNKAMRDPTIYRGVESKHHRTGDQFCVYPTYDFACPIVDSLEGVTHVFRSAEYNERNDQADYILKNLGLSKPLFFHYGRISIKDAETSKRKIKAAIAEGLYSGWDDVRLYTFRGLMKRGLQFSALEDFMKETGYSTVPVTLDPSKLWQINRKHIDKDATRYMVIDKSHKMFSVEISQKVKTIPKYGKNPELGQRDIFYDNTILISEPVNETICLVNWGSKMSMKNDDGKLIPVEDKTNKYIPWVTQNHVEVIVQNINGNLITTDTFYGEEAMKSLKVGEFVQLIQKGYYICADNDSKSIKLISAC